MKRLVGVLTIISAAAGFMLTAIPSADAWPPYSDDEPCYYTCDPDATGGTYTVWTTQQACCSAPASYYHPCPNGGYSYPFGWGGNQVPLDVCN